MTAMPRLGDHTRDQVNRLQAHDYCRMVSCLQQTNGAEVAAIDLYQERWPRSISHDLIRKAAVIAGSTDGGWASPLTTLAPLQTAFVGLARAASLLGKLPHVRKLPFNTAVPAQTGGGTYGWVGQGKPKPLTALAFATVSLGFAKIAGIIVLTEELMRMANPAAEEAVRQDMIAGVAGFMDAQLIDPAVAAVAGVHPGSLTQGIGAAAPTGTDGAALLADVRALIAGFLAANQDAQFIALLMRPADAVRLAIAANVTTVGAAGGSFFGIDVVTGAVGPRIVLIDQQQVLVADDDEMRIDVSRESSLQMDSAPANSVDATTIMVSLWQHNHVGLRVERYCTWARAREAAVALIEGAAYL